MPFNDTYRRQVALLIRVLPIVAEQECFALKGGTAINLFIRDMPRLSVDIDLTYLPIQPRAQSLKAIDTAMKSIATNIRKNIEGVQVNETATEGAVTTLYVSIRGAQIKIEVTPVLRGCVYDSELRSVSSTVEQTFGFAEIRVVSFSDLYAGKIVAALDRQHPRDLFDVRDLLANEGVGDKLRVAFLIYLLSHDRPMHEVLAPRRKNLDMEFARGFEGMTAEPAVSTCSSPGAASNVFQYDTAGRLTEEAQLINGMVDYKYDLNGNRTKVSSGDLTVTYQYDARNRMTDTIIGSADEQYGYDEISRLTSRTTGYSYSPSAAYQYFPDNDLQTLAWSNIGNGKSVTFTYGYNSAHQRNSVSVSDGSYLGHPSSAQRKNYTPNDLNQYTAVGSVTPTYNSNGDLTYDGTNTYHYDIENQLTSVDVPSHTVSYTYDPLGRRSTATVDGATTDYLFDGQNVIMESNRTGLSVTHDYAYGPTPGQPIRDFNHGASGNITEREILEDGLGSTIATTYGSSAPQTVEHYTYDPYGLASGASATVYQFAGQRLDPETGLYNDHARMYSPTLGRFLQPDPAGYDASKNLYVYVGNDPINTTDPSGLCYPECTVAAGAIIGGISGGGSYLWLTNNPSLGGFLARTGQGAVTGAAVGSGYGLLEILGIGAGANVAGSFATAASDSNLDRYGDSLGQNVVVVGEDAFVGGASVYVGQQTAGLAGPLAEGLIGDVSDAALDNLSSYDASAISAATLGQTAQAFVDPILESATEQGASSLGDIFSGSINDQVFSPSMPTDGGHS